MPTRGMHYIEYIYCGKELFCPMIKIVLDNELRIFCSAKQARGFMPFVQKQLTFDNPEYIAAVRAGRWISPELRDNRKVEAFVIERRSIILPREYWYRLRRYLRKNSLAYKFKDNTVFRKSRKKFRYKHPVTLRPYQRRCVKEAVARGRGIIVAPCGSGKTEILTAITQHLNQWTLILVHTDDLMTQMRSRLQKALGQRIGIIKQQDVIIRPITVASIQTLARRSPQDLPEDFYIQWGVVICDEVHHAPVRTWTEVVRRFPARHRYGTTATDFRADQLEPLMFATIGYRVATVTYEELYEAGYLIPPEVRLVDTDFASRNTNYQQLIRTLVEDEDRNELIVDKLLKARNHYNLILSSRIDHLERIRDRLIERAPVLEDKVRTLIGKKTRRERRQTLKEMSNGEINFIFATQLADEGLDVPILDRLHLVYPSRSMGKIMQQCGRIQRIHPNKTKGIVYDYVDSANGIFARQSDERLKTYKRMKANIVSTIMRPKFF